jgi:hypothetical protein
MMNFTSSAITSLDYNTLEQQDVVVLNELETIPQALQVTFKSLVEKLWERCHNTFITK